MEAGKACDAFGLITGFVTEQADAAQACVQAKLSGIPSWVRLPWEQWPIQWFAMRDPVAPCVWPFLGTLMRGGGGGGWEKVFVENLCSSVFEPIEEWRSCYYHPHSITFRVVYVDAFKLSGDAWGVSECWKFIQAH